MRVNNRGGKRQGSGRKAIPDDQKKVKISIAISNEALAIAKQQKSVSGFIDELIKKSKT